jgi:hypothetical protein
VLEVAQHDPGLLGEGRLHEHLVAAHVDDVVDVLDVDRALLDARTAGGAGPEHVEGDDALAGDAVLADMRFLVAHGADERTLGFSNSSGRYAVRRGSVSRRGSLAVCGARFGSK